MVDAISGDVPANKVSAGPPQNFQLKNDLSPDKIKELLTQLSRNGRGPNGATFNWSYFAGNQYAADTEFKVSLDTDQPTDSQINRKSLLALLAAVRSKLSQGSFGNKVFNLGTVSRTDRNNNLVNFNYFNLLAIGSGTGKVDDTQLISDDAFKDTIYWLLQLFDELDDKKDQKDSGLINTTMPSELQSLIDQNKVDGRLSEANWALIFTTVIAPLKAAPLSSEVKLDAYPDRRLPTFRKFLRDWVTTLFKNLTYEKYFKDEVLSTTQKKQFIFADEDLLVLLQPNNKNAADELILTNLFTKFKQIIDGILSKKEADEVMKKYIEEQAKEAATGGGGGESDSTDATEEPEPLPTESAAVDGLTIQDAENRVRQELATSLTARLNLEPSISSQPKTIQLLFRQQIKTELLIQVDRLFAYRAELIDPANGLLNPDPAINTIGIEAFESWLPGYVSSSIAQISAEQAEELTQTVLDFALQLLQITDEDKIAKDDLKTKKLSSSELDKLVKEYQAYLQSDFNNLSYDEFVQFAKSNPAEYRSLFEKSQTNAVIHARLNNVLLFYLQNQGITGLANLDQLDYTLQRQFNEEIDAFISSLTLAEQLRLNDPTFAALLAARFNRELLLGRFKNKSLQIKLHELSQAALINQQAQIKAQVDLVTGADALIGASQYSPEYINSLSLEEFNRVFGKDVPPALLEKFKEQQIKKWKESYQQSAIIQRLILLYGSDFDFIRSLDTVDKLNLMFGLRLPDGIKRDDVLALQDYLIQYWQLEIVKQRNERNLALTTKVAPGLGLDKLDAEDIKNKEFLANQIQKKSLAKPLLGGHGNRAGVGKADYDQFNDPRVLKAHSQLYKGSAEIEGFDQLYIFGLPQDQLQILGLRDRWQIAQMLQAEQRMAGLAEHQTLAELMAAQIAQTEAYQAEAIQKQSWMSQMMQRARGQQSAQKAAAGIMEKGGSAALGAAVAANPYLNALNKASDVIQQLTGLSKSQQLAAGTGLAMAALMNLVYQMSKLGGLIGGIVGGVVAAPFGPAAMALAVPTGAMVGNVVADWMGINRSVLDFGGGGSMGGAGFGNAAAGSSATSAAKAAVPSTPVSAFGNASGVTMTVFTAATGTVAFIATTTIHSALLLPEKFDLSEVVSMTKTTVQSQYNESPQSITYSITIRPIDGAVITVTDAEDVFATINYNEEARTADSLGAGNPNIPAAPDYDAFKAQLETELIGTVLQPGEEKTFTYTIPFDSSYAHAKIINTFTLTFDAVVQGELGEERLTGQKAVANASVCFGECPQPEGCFNFVNDPPPGILYTLDVNGTSHKQWSEAEMQRVTATFAARAGTSQVFTNMLCFGNKEGSGEERPIALYRLDGSNYGGWALSDSEIGLYDLAFSGTDNAVEYTVVHEFSHLVDYRNGQLSNGIPGPCPITYPAKDDEGNCDKGEIFAESSVLYVVQNLISFDALGERTYRAYLDQTQNSEVQAQYDYIQQNVFTDVEF